LKDAAGHAVSPICAVNPPKVPFVDLLRQYELLRPELEPAVLGALGRGDYILGADTAAFELEFAAFNQAPFCVGVANGTDALHLGLLALGIGPGDEVLVPANSYIASALAVSMAGAKPVLVDCDPVTSTMDPAAAARAVTARTRAIMPVHLYGHPADMDPLMDLAKAHGLRVIEDNAQGHGATYKGRICGTIGDIGCFSFYPGKNLGAYGDGGALVTADGELARKLAKLRNYGQEVKYVHTEVGFNSRLDTVQGAILRVKLRHLKRWTAQRAGIAARYVEQLAGVGLELPEVAPWAAPVWHLFVVRTRDRARLQAALDAAGIGYGIHYPIPIHLQGAYRSLGHGPGDFPVAEDLAGRILSLPMFPELTVEEQARVVAACRAGV